jgi:Phage integrase family
MTALVDTRDLVRSARPDARQAARTRFPARSVAVSWSATEQPRHVVEQRLTAPPFISEKPDSQRVRAAGVRLLLDWLTDQPGESWQQRWAASGADPACGGWRRVAASWLRAHGGDATWRVWSLSSGLLAAIGADVIRPSMAWVVSGTTAQGGLVRVMSRGRDVEGFARLRALCDADPDIAEQITKLILNRSAEILAAKGGFVDDITIGDVLELLDTERQVNASRPSGAAALYRILRRAGIFGETAPATLHEVRAAYGQRTPQELIDRYQLACRPVRDLLVDYLRERQPALDYTSLESLAFYLGKRFWADLEQHHPGIDSLHLPVEVADAWKQRLRTKTVTVRTADGEKTTIEAPRINYRESLTPVRALYLDLAHWAVEDPARWARWVAPCPVGEEEVNRRKAKRQLKSRMDARTRERLPVLPALRASVDRRRRETAELLAAARQARPGETFTAAGHTLVRAHTPHTRTDKVWADDPATGRRRDLTLEEDHAFWAYALVEVLSATGVRVEELLELSHHSLIQYRLPTTGEVVPLLQIAPSKTDAERLLLVSPDLADVLSSLIRRIREPSGAVPVVPAYDPHECRWQQPAPLLFQRRINGENRAITRHGVRQILGAALDQTGLTEPTTGAPLRFTPHDFRRLFITDAVLNGLPPHIAQVIAGHRDINVTMGYKAVYPDEAIQAHLAFLARRRALRPTDEYRTPTDDEWQQFLGHFERRKVSIGTCGRAFGSPCIHEHACVRCALLWPDPTQHERLNEIRDNLQARIAEAEREGWLGEVEGLQVSLTAAEDKLAQIDKRVNNRAVALGTPTLPTNS